MVLGFLQEARYSNSEIKLQDGDLILACTDGVLEAQNAAGEFFDRDRVRSWLMSAAADGVEGFTEMALADLERWSGSGSFHDDVTFVVARFTGRKSGSSAHGGRTDISDAGVRTGLRA